MFDKKTAMSAINVVISNVSLDETMSALWTDDPAYAKCLMSTFEWLWKQAVPTAQRIEELLTKKPPQT